MHYAVMLLFIKSTFRMLCLEWRVEPEKGGREQSEQADQAT